MLELFAVYALLLACWGLWHARSERTAAQPAPAAPPEIEPAVKRGDAARRLLNTLP